jgi:hypothetical protein
VLLRRATALDAELFEDGSNVAAEINFAGGFV